MSGTYYAYLNSRDSLGRGLQRSGARHLLLEHFVFANEAARFVEVAGEAEPHFKQGVGVVHIVAVVAVAEEERAR